MKRAIIVVIDGLGVGALPDAGDYDDAMTCNTLANTAEACGGLDLPNLGKMGLGNILPIRGVPPAKTPIASFGRMIEVSKGKDSTTGHWELAGHVLARPFRVYPDGFPNQLLDPFIEKIGVEGVLANHPASGTEVIERYHKEHTRTGLPIVYTSADSVFQIAADVNVVPLNTLYHWCEVAREMVNGEFNISRVIARPYEVKTDGPRRLSAARHDYGIEPTEPTLLNWVVEQGGRVVGIGKIADLFVESGITHTIHTDSNLEGLATTHSAIAGKLDLKLIEVNPVNEPDPKFELIFTNLVDTDTQFGHRRDPKGYRKALEEIDRQLPMLLTGVTPDDVLIITSDHGNDPTANGTDHTREYVPILLYGPDHPAQDLGTIPSFAFVAETVRDWLGQPITHG